MKRSVSSLRRNFIERIDKFEEINIILSSAPVRRCLNGKETIAIFNEEVTDDERVDIRVDSTEC